MTAPIAPWLISARVSPPRISIHVNSRTALVQRLMANQDKPVILLEAPAGFGKTLLLSQWRERLMMDGARVAWLSIEQTAQPDALLPYMAFAFHHGGLDTRTTGLLAAPSFSASDFNWSLGRLLACIEHSRRRCVLILDDLENITTAALADLNRLLRLQPDSLRLVFACRKNPGLGLSALTVAGNVLTLGAPQLAFSRAEAADFFAGAPAAAQLDRIMAETGGWPVALQLIRAFGAKTAAPVKYASLGDPYSLCGSSRVVADYLREQLFDNLSARQQAFLRQTAVLDVITAASADYLADSCDAGRIIQSLHHLGGIFSPLEHSLEHSVKNSPQHKSKDTQQAWRLHPLVREYARQQLMETAADQYAALNKKAAAWMIEQGRGLEAMRYALAAGDSDYAAEIMERMGGVMLWIREGMSRLTAGLELLEGHALPAWPRIQLARSLVHAKAGKLVKARQAFAAARAASQGFAIDRPGGDDALLRVEGFVIEMMIAQYGCVPVSRLLSDEAFRFLLQHAQQNAGDEPLLPSYINNLQCLTALQYGEFDDCRAYGAQAIAQYHGLESVYGELFIYFYLGMAELARTNTAAALAEYNRAVRIIHANFPGDTGLRLLGHAILAEFYWESGDAANTKKYIRHVINHIEDMEAYFEIYATAYQTAISYLLFEHGADQALAFSRQARARATAQSLHRLALFLSALELSVYYFIDDADQAHDTIQRQPALFAGLNDHTLFLDKTWRELEALMLALARSYRLLKLTDKDCPADSALHAILDIAERSGNRRLLMQTQIQRALTGLINGHDQQAALASLAAAVMLAGRGGYLRPLLNEYQGIRPLLPALLEYMQVRDFAPSAIDTVNALISRQPPPVGERAGRFSAREMEILALLCEGHPDKMIARRVGLSAHGVRYHLKKIYHKLDVANRAQAISRAHALGVVMD